jgi:two-component system sensor histidine kinase RegB
MPQHPLKQRIGPFALARTLAWLRLCAIAGQSMAVMVCSWWMQINIPTLSLLLGIDMLAVFAVFAAWRISQPWPVREWETVCHVAADTLVLGYLLYFTGGASNPFVTLLLVPIALSAAALSERAVLAVAAIAVAAYTVLLHWYVPLPMNQFTLDDHGFSLHVAGMGVNFLITALLLGFFINRLARAVRMQQLEVQRVRERALRDEGILAIATQAAGAAHELNTPLSTMRTLLPELRREHAADRVLDEDLELLEGQVDRCRTILREMVAFGKAQLSQEPERVALSAFIHGCVERFHLLRPEAELQLQVQSDLDNTTLQHAARFASCIAQPAQQCRRRLRPARFKQRDAGSAPRRRLAGVDRSRSRPWLHIDGCTRFHRQERQTERLGHRAGSGRSHCRTTGWRADRDQYRKRCADVSAPALGGNH